MRRSTREPYTPAGKIKRAAYRSPCFFASLVISLLAALLLSASMPLPAQAAAGGSILAGWPARDGQSGTQKATASVVDSSGNTYITGYQNLPNGEADNFYTIKLTSGGALDASWGPQVFDLAGFDDRALAITVDSSDDVYVTGYATKADQGKCLYTIKYKGSDGSKLWEGSHTPAGGNLLTFPISVAVDGANLYVAANLRISATDDNILILKYNANGSTPNTPAVLVYDYLGMGRQDTAVSINARGGKVAVTGFTYNGTTNDMLTLLFDSALSLQHAWQQSSSGGNASGKIVKIDSAANVIVSGYDTLSQGTDIYTAKLHGSAPYEQQWSKRFQGQYDDEPTAMALDSLNDVYIAGTFSSIPSYTDFYTARYAASNGTMVWEATYNSGSNVDVPTGIAVDESGDVYVTGYSKLNVSDTIQTLKYKKASGSLLWQKNYGKADDASLVDLRPVGIGVSADGVHVAGWTTTVGAVGSGYDYYALKYEKGTLERPIGLTATASSNTLIQLAWVSNSAGSEDGFKIERCTGRDCSFASLDSGFPASVGKGVVSYDDSSVTANTYYNYRVLAYKAAENTAYSNTALGLTVIVTSGNPVPGDIFTYDSSDHKEDTSPSIAVGPDNHPVVTGYSYNLIDSVFNYYTIKLNRLSLSGAKIWGARYDNSLGNNKPNSVAVDNLNNVIVSGSSVLPPIGKVDGDLDINSLYTLKYLTNAVPDGDGDIIESAAKQYNGPGKKDDISTQVAIDKSDGSNNFVIIGHGKQDVIANHEYIYAVKYDTNANQLWEGKVCDNAGSNCQFFDAGPNGTATGVTIAPDGSVYVAGQINSGTQLAPNFDYLLLKFCGKAANQTCSGTGTRTVKGGQLLWSAIYDSGKGDDVAKGIAVDASSNAYVTGSVATGGGKTDFHTIKYDGSNNSQAVVLWAGNGLSTDGSVSGEAIAIAIDPNNNDVLVAGNTFGGVNDSDYTIARYKSDGTFNWTDSDNNPIRSKSLLRPGYDDKVVAMGLDMSGNIYLAGNTRDTVGSNGTASMTVLFDPNGTIRNATVYNASVSSPKEDKTTSLAVNSLGEAFITGTTNSGSGGVNNLNYLVYKVPTYKLQAPSQVAITSTTYTSAGFSWKVKSDTTAAGVTGYRIKRADNQVCANNPSDNAFVGGTTPVIKTILKSVTTPAADVTYSDNGADFGILTHNTSYCYVFQSYHGVSTDPDYEETEWVPLNLKTLNPVAPLLTATANNTTQITLSGSVTTTGQTSFEIQRCTGAGCDFSTLDDGYNPKTIAAVGNEAAISHVDTSVCPGVSYSYRIRVIGAGWSSIYSSGVTAVAAAVPATAITLAATTYSESQINLSWNRTTTDETGFKIWRCPGKHGEACPINTADNNYLIDTTVPGVTSYASAGLLDPVNGLARNATFQHMVTAFKTATCTTGWPINSNTTSTATLYTKPVLAVTFPNSTQATISWTDTTTAESAFILQRCTTAGCNFTTVDPGFPPPLVVSFGKGSPLSYADTSVCTSADYEYRIKPVNAGIYSASDCWKKSTPLAITNFRPDFLTRVKIPKYTGMQADFNDIRIYDETAKKELPYWIESVAADKTTATVWFKTGSSSMISLIYDNGAATNTGNIASIFGSGVMAFFPFSEGAAASGVTYDKSGLGNDLSLNYIAPYGLADPGASRFGTDSGNVISANGTRYRYASRGSANLPTGSIATIEAWIYPKSPQINSYNSIASFGQDYQSQRVYLALQDNGRPAMLGYNNDFFPATGPQATFNAWNHIAVVLNGTAITLYMNGQPVPGTLGLASNLLSMNLFVGADRDGIAFNGFIDDVRIYNRALTAPDIALRYAPNIPSVTVGAAAGTSACLVYNGTWGGDDTYFSSPSLAVHVPSPVAPASLNAVANNEAQVTLTWTNKTALSDQTGFKIFRCAGSGCTPVQIDSITSSAALNAQVTYVDKNPQTTALVPGTLYKYVVRAYKTGVSCPWDSPDDSAPTNNTVTMPLTAPSGLARTYSINTQCNDLRFVDSNGTTPLSYWLEYGCNTPRTKLHVNILSIPGNNATKQISLLYGNPIATPKSNGSTTFDFFDDFTGSTVDLSKWTISGGDAVDSLTNTAMSVSGGFLHGGKSGVVTSRSTFTTGQSIQAKVKSPGFAPYNTGTPILSLYQDASHYSTWGLYSDGYVRFSNAGSANQDSPAPTAPAALTDNLIYTLSMNDNATITPSVYDAEPNVLANYFVPAVQNKNYTTANMRFGGNVNYQFTSDWDWIRVRKTSSSVNASFTLLGGLASSAYSVPDGVGGNEAGTWGVKRLLTLTNSGSTTAVNWQVSLDSLSAVNGIATSGSSKTTLEDTAKNWTANQWGGYYLKMGSGLTATIIANTATTLTINPAFATAIVAGETYQIMATAAGTFFDTTPLATDQIQFSWINNTVSETGYIIERCDNTLNSGSCATTFNVDKTYPLTGNGLTSFIDSDVKRNNAYCYRVSPIRGIAPLWPTSVVSSPSCEPARQQLAPVLTASGSTSQINLSWTEADFASESGTASGGSTSTLVHSGKTWGTNQWAGFYLKITSAGVNSGLSKLITSNTNNTITVGAAFNATTSGSTYQIVPADGTGNMATGIIGEYGYEIERCPGTGCTPTSADRMAMLAPNAVRSYVDDSLCGGIYNYRIHVVKYGTNGTPLTAAADKWPDYSNKSEAGISSAPVPTLVKAAPVSESQISITWKDNTVDETSFNIYRCKDVGGIACSNFTLLGTSPAISSTGSMGTYNDTRDIAQGSTYRYQVKATGTSAACGAGQLWESLAGTPDPAVYAAGDAYAIVTVNAPGSLIIAATDTTTTSFSWGDTTASDNGFILERCAGIGCTDFTPISGINNVATRRTTKVFYTFNNTLKDSSGSGLDLTGTATLDSSGVTFANGTDSLKSQVSTVLNSDAHAIEFDFKINAVPTAWAKVFGYAPTDNGGSDRSPGIWVKPNEKRLHWRYHDSSKKNVGVDGLGVEGEASTEFTLSQWYHIRGEKSGNSFKIYLDGKLVVSRTDFPNPKLAGNAALLFGYDGASNAANISIRNFNIDDGVASTTTSKYKAFYTFNNTLADSSGNGLDLVKGGGGAAYYTNGGLNFNGNTSYSSSVTGALDTDSHAIEFDLRLGGTNATLTKIFSYGPTENTGSDRSPGIFINPNAYTLKWSYHDAVKNDLGVSALGVDGDGGTPFTVNQWYHIRGEKSGSSFRLFVNGRLVVDRNDFPNPKFSGSAPLYFSGTNYIGIKNFSIDGNIQSIDASECAGTTYSYRMRSVKDGFASAKVRIDNFLPSFPTRVTIPASFVAGRDKSQITDLRFYDYTDKADIPYWLENTSPDGTATVWIKTRTTNSIMLYANKNAATAANVSDGSKVFNFFDGFSSLDASLPVLFGNDSSTHKWSKSINRYDYKVRVATCAAGCDATNLVDTAKGWNPGSYDPVASPNYLLILSVADPLINGANAGKFRKISSHTATSITVDTAFPVAIAAGDTYQVLYDPAIAANIASAAVTGDTMTISKGSLYSNAPVIDSSPIGYIFEMKNNWGANDLNGGGFSISNVPFATQGNGTSNGDYYLPHAGVRFGGTGLWATATNGAQAGWLPFAADFVPGSSNARPNYPTNVTGIDQIVGIEFRDAQNVYFSSKNPFTYSTLYEKLGQTAPANAWTPQNPSSSATKPYLFLGHVWGANGGVNTDTPLNVDWVRVRPYASPEPIGTIETGLVIPTLDPGTGGAGNWAAGSGSPVVIANFQPNYQTRLVISKASGMKDDFSDIRFFDTTARVELPYYFESVTTGVKAVVWLKTGATNSIVMYYGNPGAVSTAITATGMFDFYDDFTTLDAARWAKSAKNAGITKGTAAAGSSATTLQDDGTSAGGLCTGAAWTVDCYKDKYLLIMNVADLARSANLGQYRKISTSSTGRLITVDTSFDATIGTGDTYQIIYDPTDTANLSDAAVTSGHVMSMTKGALYTKLPVINSSPIGYIFEMKNKWTTNVNKGGGITVSNSQYATSSNGNDYNEMFFAHADLRLQTGGLQAILGNGAGKTWNVGTPMMSGSVSSGGNAYTNIVERDWISAIEYRSAKDVYFSVRDPQSSEVRYYMPLNNAAGVWAPLNPYPTATAPYIFLGHIWGENAGDTLQAPLNVDWVRVRRIASPEPAASVTTTQFPTLLNPGTGGSWTTGTQLRISNFQPDYQTRMTVSASQAAAMKSDLSDLRFYDTTAQKELSYWIDGSVNLGAIPAAYAAWKLREPLAISNFQPNFLTRVVIPTASLAAMKPNLADLRFYDYTANAELPHWLEAISGSTATVWVKTGAYNSIAMYYGNPLATSTSSRDAILGTGLVGHWPFEETAKTTTGNISDASGNGMNGLLVAMPAGYGVVAGGKYGNGLSLDGAAGYVTVTDSAGSPLRINGSMTVELWYKHDNTNVQNAMILKKDSSTSSANYSLYLDGLANDANRNLIFRVTNGTITSQTVAINGAPLMTDSGSHSNWYHIIGRYDAASGRTDVFINGVNTATNIGGTAISMAACDNPLAIGYSSVGPKYTKGMLDDVRIYSRALLDTEIAARYAANTPSITVGYPPVWLKTGQFNTIAMYYGNPNATPVTDGSKVFDFFEGFDALDGSKWGVTGTASATSGKLTVTSGAVYSKTPITSSPQNLRFEMKGTWQSVANGAYGGLALADASGTYSMNGNNNKLAYLIDANTAGTTLYPYAADGTGTDPTNMYNLLTPGATTNTGSGLYLASDGLNKTIRKPVSGFWTMPDGSNITDIYVKGSALDGGWSDFYVRNTSGASVARVWNGANTGSWVSITPTSGIYTTLDTGQLWTGQYIDVTQVKPGISGFAPVNDGIVGIEFNPNGKLEYVINGSDNSELKRYSVVGTWNSSPYLWLGYFRGSNSTGETIDTMTVDWVRARKYAATEPKVLSDAIGVNQESAPENYQFLNNWSSSYSNTVTLATPQVANLVSNSDFEASTDKWTVGSGAWGDTSTAVSGLKSLKISKTLTQNTSELVSIAVPQLTPGGSYTLTGNIKSSLTNGYAFCRLAVNNSSWDNPGVDSPEFDVVSNPAMTLWSKTDNAKPADSNAAGINGDIPIGTNLTGDNGSIQSQGIIVDDGGVYRTWYTGNDNAVSGSWRIFYATSSDGGVTWTKLNNTTPAPSNTTGSNGQIPLGTNDANIGDKVHAYASPSVIKDLNAPPAERYKMWYSGHDGSRWRIYYATSPDGLTWTKYDNTIPDNSDTVGTRGRIPLGTLGSSKGDSTAAFAPSVIQLSPTSYQMWYAGADDAFVYRIFYATSTDGLNWVKVKNDVPAPKDFNVASDFGRIPSGTAGSSKGDVAELRFHSVIKDGSTYKMWYSGRDDNADTTLRKLRIYYAESPDGVAWTKKDNTIPGVSDGGSTNGRIPAANTGSGDAAGAYAPTVVKVDASTYKMWYAGFDATSSSLRRIFYASSTNGLDWTKQKNEISEPSDTVGDFGRIPLGVQNGDSRNSLGVAILKDNGLYRMWYTGNDTSGSFRIFHATSPDGRSWTKYNSKTPAVSDGSSTDGRIPLGSSGKGDSKHAYPSTIIKDDTAPAASRYKMWYSGNDGTYWRIFYATSPDGLTWTKRDNSKPPVSGTVLEPMDSGTTPTNGNGRIPFGSAGKGDSAGTISPTVLQESPTSYKMWYAGSTDNVNWRIYYATSIDGENWTKLDNTLPPTTGTILEPLDSGITPTNGNGRIPYGSSGKGDGVSILRPMVIKESPTSYKMWYTGKDASNWRNYYAISTDGLNWTKQNNTIPANSDTTGTWGRVPLGTSSKGDQDGAYVPTVMQDGPLFRMWYSGVNAGVWRIYNAVANPSNVSSYNDNQWHSFSLPITLKNTMGGAALDGNNLRVLCGIARDDSGSDGVDTINLDMIQLVPANPFNLSASKFSESRIDLAWSNSTKDESGFRILRCAPPADCTNPANFTQVATVGAGVTSFKDTANLQPNTAYQYEIAAYKDGVCGWTSGTSAVVPVATGTAAPTLLTAKEINTTQVDLTWTDNSVGESGFAVVRSSDGGTTFAPLPSTAPNPTLALINSTSFSDTTACPDTSYSYRIRSLNKGLSLDGGLANSCTSAGDGWSKRKHLYITNFQAQFQTAVSVISVAGMKADFSDLRFYDASDSKELPYWIESITGSPATAKIWLKTGDNNNIDMYYGNQRATSPANAVNVFDFFDDFNGGTVDASRWTVVNGSGLSVSGGYLHGTNSSGQIKSIATFPVGKTLEVKAKATRWADNPWYIGGFSAPANYLGWVPYNDWRVSTNTWPDSDGRGMYYNYLYGNSWSKRALGNNGNYAQYNSTNFPSKNEVMSADNMLYRVTVKDAASMALHIDELDRLDGQGKPLVLIDEVNVSNYADAPIVIGGSVANPGESLLVDWDWVRVRKYAATEPSVTLQAEITSTSNCFSFQNQWGNVATTYESNTSNSVTTAAALAPSNLTATEMIPNKVNLAWLDNTGDETGFEVQDCCTNCTPASCVNVTVPANTSTYSASSNVWSKRVPVAIASFLPNVPTRLTLTISDATGVKSDLSDIRFYDTGVSPVVELPYWVESISGGSATVWIMPGANNAVYMYYGNANGTSASSPASVFGSGLVGYWLFQSVNGSNSTQDVSGYNHSGTLMTNNTAGIIAPNGIVGGKFGNGLSLNGTTNYVNVADTTGSSLDITGDITVETWFKYTGALPITAPIRLVSKRDTLNNSLYELIMANINNDGIYRLRFVVYGTNGTPQFLFTQPTAPNIADNNWHHFAGRYVASTGTVSILIDGVHDTALDAVATPPISVSTSDRPFTFGAALNSSNVLVNFFPGTLDEVRIYNRALGDPEIASHYTAALPSGTATIASGDIPVNHSYSIRALKAGALCGWPTAWSTASGVNLSETIHLDATALNSMTVKLDWNNLPVDGRGYEVEKKLVNGSFANIATIGNILTYTDKVGVNPLRQYTYRVRKAGGTAPTLFTDDFNTGLNPALWNFEVGHSWRVPDAAAIFSSDVMPSSNSNGTSKLLALAGNVEFNSVASGVGVGYNYEYMSLANLASLTGDFDMQLDYNLPDGVINSTSNNVNYYAILRLGFGSPTGSNYTITLSRVKAQIVESGSATTGTPDKKTLADVRAMVGTSTPLKKWTTDQFKNYYLQMTSGSNNRQTRLITGNTANTITVATPFGSQIVSGDAYSINSITGSASSAGTPFVLNDTAPGWTDSQWVGFALKMTGGSNAGQTRPIIANGTSSITVSPAFSYAIASGDAYQIIDTSHPAQEFYRLASTEPGGINDFTFTPAAETTGQMRMVKTSNNDNTGSITFYTSPGGDAWVPVKKYDLPGLVTPTLLAIYQLANQAEAAGTSVKATIDNIKIRTTGSVNQNPYSNEATVTYTYPPERGGATITTTPPFVIGDGDCTCTVVDGKTVCTSGKAP